MLQLLPDPHVTHDIIAYVPGDLSCVTVTGCLVDNWYRHRTLTAGRRGVREVSVLLVALLLMQPVVETTLACAVVLWPLHGQVVLLHLGDQDVGWCIRSGFWWGVQPSCVAATPSC